MQRMHQAAFAELHLEGVLALRLRLPQRRFGGGPEVRCGGRLPALGALGLLGTPWLGTHSAQRHSHEID